MNLLRLSILLIVINFLAIDLFAANPQNFAGNPYKSGTFNEDVKNKILSRLCSKLSTRPDTLELTHRTKNGNFLIHYTLNGRDAVDPTDNNNNFVPDYIDSVDYYFEYILDKLTNDLGYRSPVDDMNGGGTPEYDIYVSEIGHYNPDKNYFGGTYGLTFPERTITSNGKYSTTTSYLIIDNNYSKKDSMQIGNTIMRSFYSSEINGLKVTAIHEFFHAVQFRYAKVNFGKPFGSIYEMSSTWIENLIFPEVKDYLQYMPSVFYNGLKFNLNRYIFSNPESNNGYRWGIFFEYLSEKYDPSIIRRMWEIIGEGNYGYYAIDMALQEKNTTLEDAWCDFMPWLYYSGKRAIDGEYFRDAELFPTFELSEEIIFSSPQINREERMLPFQVSLYRVRFQGGQTQSEDTLDLMTTVTNYQEILNSTSAYEMMYFDVYDSEKPNSWKLGNLNYWASLESNKRNCYSQYLMGGQAVDRAERIFPQPFNPNSGTNLYFHLESDFELYDEVILTIYNDEMLSIYSKKLQVLPHKGKIILTWNEVPKDLQSGIYIYSIVKDSKQQLGKFAVRRD